jgi:hypothetical protein
MPIIDRIRLPRPRPPWLCPLPTRVLGLASLARAEPVARNTDTIALSRHVAPGDWNDADQPLIGDDGPATAEERAQMGLWSTMAARRDDPRFAASSAVLTHRRAIAIDQDALGAGAAGEARANR